MWSCLVAHFYVLHLNLSDAVLPNSYLHNRDFLRMHYKSFSHCQVMCVQEQADMNQNDGERRKETGREWRFVRKGVWGRKNIAGIPDICRVQQSWQSPLIQRASLSPLLTFTRHPVTTLQSQAWKKANLQRCLWFVLPAEEGGVAGASAAKLRQQKCIFFLLPLLSG